MSTEGERVWRVLVADDEDDLRRLMTMTLEFDEQLEVVASARSGAEAIELASAVSPDLAVLDQMLGGPMTGLDVAEALRKANPALRVILFSAADHVVELGAGQIDALVAKTEIGDLADIARRVLAGAGGGGDGRDEAPTPAE
jgi:DNA-binding NarL/FixJ family response regulator